MTSAGIECDASGFISLMTGMSAEVEKELPLCMGRIASRAEDIAVSMAPVVTGNLRSRIGSMTGKDGSTHWAQIGTNLDYAPYVEFGTGRRGSDVYVASDGSAHTTEGLVFRADWAGMGPMPYIRPALFDFRDLWISMIEDAVRRSAR